MSSPDRGDNEKARILGLRGALAVVALVSLGALFFTRGVPAKEP